MPTVQNTVTDPAGNAIAGAVIKIDLIAGPIIAQPGYTPSTTIGPSLLINADSLGHWSAVLPGNVTLAPANTYYRIVEAGFVSAVVVPASGGPYALPSILVTPPAPASPAITGVQVAADGTVAGVRPQLNLVSGANVAISAVDNPGAARVDVTIASSGGGGGGIPSGTVVSETAYGQASTAGAASTYSRGDHTHGSPALTSAAASTSAVGDAATVGTATAPARADHVHGREAFGAVTAQTAYGAASANGVASTVARSDHTHGSPALASTTPAAETPGAAGAVGTGSTPARADHVHALPAFGTGAGTFAQGNDSRITGALQAASNLSDVANAATARGNLAAAPLASPTFTGTVTTPRLVITPAALTDAATIATDASTGNHFRVTLGGNRTLGNPTNPADGQRVIWELIQDATGSRTITLDTAFALGTDITAVTLSTGASKRDFLGAIYNAAATKWYVIALARGY